MRQAPKAGKTTYGGGREAAMLRRLLRDLRSETEGPQTALAELLCGDVPQAGRQAAVVRVIRSALYRLPLRQRELLRRFDLEGEPADAVQRSLGLSARQFYRDRRAGLAKLSRYLLGTARWQRDAVPADGSERDSPRPQASASPLRASVSSTELLRHALARNLYQSGDAECLRVMQALAQAAIDPQRRATLFLDLTEMADAFGDRDLAQQAQKTAERVVEETGSLNEADEQYFRGRIARSRANFVDTRPEQERLYAQSLAHLRRSVDANAMRLDTRAELALTLGDVALTKFGHGSFAEARAASAEASAIVHTFNLWTLPRALELVAINATLDAALTGRGGIAVQRLAKLLTMAVELGWSSVAGLLGALLVGLSATRGRYEEALQWYDRLASPDSAGLRLGDRAHLAIEASHALSMLGRTSEALDVLGFGRTGNPWPSVDEAPWHVCVGEALVRGGDAHAALAQAQIARRNYEAHHVTRGLGDAHRLIAVCYERLGELDRANEHVTEAQRLIETNGTPYALLRTLVAKAGITRNPRFKTEAIEFAHMLRALDEEPLET